MTKLTFRDAGIEDIPALVELVTSAYRGDSSRQGWTTEADLLDGNRIDPEVLRHDIDRPRSRVMIAEHPSTSAGRAADMVACAHVCAEDGAGYFGMFSVRPDLQGGGVGKALLSEAERLVRDEWQLPSMRMTVIDIRDELIAFYQRRGYHRTGIHKPFPYGDARFGIPKRNDLRFELLEKILSPNGLASERRRSFSREPLNCGNSQQLAAEAAPAKKKDHDMADWIRVCATSELLPGESQVAWDGDTPILVLNYDGDFYALEDRCSHEDFELSAGSFNAEDATIECVLHGATFDIRDGRALSAPAYVPVFKFPVMIKNGAVWTRDDR